MLPGTSESQPPAPPCLRVLTSSGLKNGDGDRRGISSFGNLSVSVGVQGQGAVVIKSNLPTPERKPKQFTLSKSQAISFQPS